MYSRDDKNSQDPEVGQKYQCGATMKSHWIYFLFLIGSFHHNRQNTHIFAIVLSTIAAQMEVK